MVSARLLYMFPCFVPWTPLLDLLDLRLSILLCTTMSDRFCCWVLACAASANCLFPLSAFGFCMFNGWYFLTRGWYYYNFLPRVLCSGTSLFSSFLLEMFAPLLVFTQVEHVRWFGHIETCYCVLDLWNFACCYRKMQLTCGSRLSLFFLVLWKYGGKKRRKRVLHRALQAMAYVYLRFLSPWNPNFA